MTKNKTAESQNSVSDYLKKIKDEKRRKDCILLVELMSKSSGCEAKMWGTAIVGFGSYHYKYESGRKGDAPLAGLASRANAIVLYLGTEFEGYNELLKKLGKHKTGGGCLYIQKLEDVDLNILSKMIKNAVAYKKKKHS